MKYFLCFWILANAFGIYVANPDYTNFVLRARCQARCNNKYGVQRNESSPERDDIYQPYICKENLSDCNQCSLPCSHYHSSENECKTNCMLAPCVESCVRFYKHDAIPTIKNVILTPPTIVCKYTDLVAGRLDYNGYIGSIIDYDQVETEDVVYSSEENSSLIYLKWNVKQRSETKVPLTFIISLKNKTNDIETDWEHVMVTNNSFLSISGLSPTVEYDVQITAVAEGGIVDEPKSTGWTKMPSAKHKVDPPVGLVLLKQFVKEKFVHAVVKWQPGANGGCFFKLLWWVANKAKYEVRDVKGWTKYEFELINLSFDSEYIVEVYGVDKELSRSSTAVNVTFKTLNCLNSTNHNYTVCAPDQLLMVNISHSTSYTLNGLLVSNVTLAWEFPSYVTSDNPVEHVVLTWRKEPILSLSEIIEPHHGDLIVPSFKTKVTIAGLHWNSLYTITTQIRSEGGISDKHRLYFKLGNAYKNFQETENLEPTNSSNTSLSITKATNTNNSALNWYYFMMIPFLLLVMGICVFLLYKRHSSIIRTPLGKAGNPRAEEINPLYSTPSPQYYSDDENSLLPHDEFEINISKLRMTEVIGEGAFGKVFKAVLLCEDSSKSKIVAVKVLREYAQPEERRNLLLEIDAMKQLGYHQNVISILACCTSGSDICLVMDYCPLGDLRNYLRSCREMFYVRSNKNSDSGISHAGQESIESRSEYSHSDGLLPPCLDRGSKGDTVPNLCPETLLSYARQIAMGMEFLAEKKYVHRDLAARNILMSTKRMVKISDFGLTRDVYETNMYRPTSSRKLPYKWMPLETIFDQVVTIKSDVWSFGIVLWEIVTLGGCPYPGIPNEDLFKLLKNGYRMEKPENCGDDLYKIMAACWQTSPSRRPSFNELRLKIERLLEATKPYLDLNVLISEEYHKPDKSTGNETEKRTEASDKHNKININPVINQTDKVNITSNRPQSMPTANSSTFISDNQDFIIKSKSTAELATAFIWDTDVPTLKSRSDHLVNSEIQIPGQELEKDLIDKGKDAHLQNASSRHKVEICDRHVLDTEGSETSVTSSSEGVGSLDINSSFPSLNYSSSVIQTPSLKHGLLNLLGRVGRRRLGGSELSQSFSLTEVSNLRKDNHHTRIKVGSASSIV